MQVKKTRVLQKLWGWVCLSINCIVLILQLAERVESSLGIGILISVSVLCYGVIKTLNDKQKDDLSVVSVLIEYICVYLITFMSAFKVAEYILSTDILIFLAIASLAELLVLWCITYRYAIRNFFRKT